MESVPHSSSVSIRRGFRNGLRRSTYSRGQPNTSQTQIIVVRYVVRAARVESKFGKSVLPMVFSAFSHTLSLETANHFSL